jgi:tetratricopeptide (TPR) repeat protein
VGAFLCWRRLWLSSVYYFRKHDWISAYRDSGRGISHLQKALELEPKLYDVYLATGTYYYWRTAKSKFLRIIAFWKTDKRELGLRELRFAIDHGRYAPNESAYALITAYFDYGKYQEAEQIYKDNIIQ